MNKLCSVLFVLALCLAGCAARGTAPVPPVHEPLGFSDIATATVLVTRGPLTQRTLLSGVVRTVWEPLFFDMEGTVAEVFIFPGEAVYEGQLLAKLDTQRPERDLQRLEETLTRLTREQERENERFTLNMMLKEMEYHEALKKAADDFDGDAMDAALHIWLDRERDALIHTHNRELRAVDIDDARRRIAELEEIINRSTIFAPADGVVSYNQIWGQRIVTTDDPILYFTLEKDIFVEYLENTLADSLLNAPRIEALVEGRVYPLAYTPMFNDTEIAMRRLRGLPLNWRFAVTEGQPEIGSFVTIVFYTVDIPDTLKIPINALLVSSESGAYVQHLVNGEMVETFVQTGARTATFVEIVNGLAEGDEIRVR
jgi:multidrug efflux pump subunit AcrA (membrane-fusion protein)